MQQQKKEREREKILPKNQEFNSVKSSVVDFYIVEFDKMGENKATRSQTNNFSILLFHKLFNYMFLLI